MEYLISAFWFALEYIYCYLFWHVFLPPRASKKKCLLVLLLAWGFSFFYTNIGLNQILKKAISFVVFGMVISQLFDGKWYRRFFVVVFGYVVGGMIDTVVAYGISLLLGVSLSEFVWFELFYIVTVTIGKLISILLAWTLLRFRSFQNFRSIDPKWLLLSLIFPLVSLAMLIVVFDGYRGHSDLSSTAVVFCGFLAVANIAIIYLVHIMEKSTKSAQEAALLKQQMEIQTDSILALEKSYRAQRQATHDFRNQLQTINDLLSSKKSDSALAYIQKLQGMQTTRIFTVNSHHPIIDAILNHKYQVAQEQDIDVQVQVNDLSNVQLETDILVVLLTNLLDNAIEACVRLPQNRIIQCRILATDSIYLSIRNTSNPVTITDNHILSTKEPREDHGYGLSRIQYILNQLNAEFAFTFENGWFEFVSEIPYS